MTSAVVRLCNIHLLFWVTHPYAFCRETAEIKIERGGLLMLARPNFEQLFTQVIGFVASYSIQQQQHDHVCVSWPPRGQEAKRPRRFAPSPPPLHLRSITLGIINKQHDISEMAHEIRINRFHRRRFRHHIPAAQPASPPPSPPPPPPPLQSPVSPLQDAINFKSPGVSKEEERDLLREREQRAAMGRVFRILRFEHDASPVVQRPIIVHRVTPYQWEDIQDMYGGYDRFSNSRYGFRRTITNPLFIFLHKCLPPPSVSRIEFVAAKEKIVAFPLTSLFHDFSRKMMCDHISIGLRNSGLGDEHRITSLNVSRDSKLFEDHFYRPLFY